MPDISNATAILLAQAVVSRSDQRWEFASIAAAVALLSVAFADIALFCFRPGTRDLTLIYFSLFCFFYAVRVLASLPSFHSLFESRKLCRRQQISRSDLAAYKLVSRS
jgi:hypothetical protein